MNYSKKYRVVTLDGFIIGHRATEKAAVELAIQQSIRLAESVEVKKRNADGEYEECRMAMNPYKFGGIDEGGDATTTNNH